MWGDPQIFNSQLIKQLLRSPTVKEYENRSTFGVYRRICFPTHGIPSRNIHEAFKSTELVYYHATYGWYGPPVATTVIFKYVTFQE